MWCLSFQLAIIKRTQQHEVVRSHNCSVSPGNQRRHRSFSLVLSEQGHRSARAQSSNDCPPQDSKSSHTHQSLARLCCCWVKTFDKECLFAVTTYLGRNRGMKEIRFTAVVSTKWSATRYDWPARVDLLSTTVAPVAIFQRVTSQQVVVITRLINNN